MQNSVSKMFDTNIFAFDLATTTSSVTLILVNLDLHDLQIGFGF